MERRFMIRIAMLACLLVTVAMVGPLWAGGTQSGFEPPPGATVTGPELWGVVMMYCSPTNNIATIRLKRVDDCNTETLTWIDLAWDSNNCPETADFKWDLPQLQGRLTSEWETTGTPYIEKVKNFDRQYDQAQDIAIISFDAMLKFYTP